MKRINPKDERQLGRLWEAIKSSRDRMRPFREDRMEMIQQYVGHHYGANGASEKVPVPFLEMAISIYVQHLVGAAPRAYTATNVDQLKAGASDLKIALDYTSERLRMEQTLWRVVQDAMFMVGATKMGLVQGETGSTWWHQAWQPFLDWIDFDDLVVDMTAKVIEAVGFIGNRYRLDLEVVQDCELYDKDVREKLKASIKSTITESGDQKADTIGPGATIDPDELRDQVELWDVWLPHDRLVLTLSADDEKSKPLRVVEWDGPDDGPYDLLGFNVVPANLLPLPPVDLWRDLHELGNQLYLKLGRQALSQKSVLPFRGGTEEDVQALNDCVDGHTFRCDGEVPKEVRYGGPDQVNLAFFLGLNELVNRVGGNLDVLGGLSPSADTLGQEKLLGDSASQRLVFMRRKLGALVDSHFTKLAHYLYKDPLVSLDLQKPIQGTSLSVPFQWSPDTRVGKPDLYQIAIEPYSMVHREPQSQMRTLLEIWNTVVMPAAPILPPENMLGAVEALLRMAADKLNLPELQDLLPYLMANQAAIQQQQQQQPQGVGPMQPPETTRNYVRRSIPGASRSQKENALAQALLGSMPQPAEAAAMMRSTG